MTDSKPALASLDSWTIFAVLPTPALLVDQDGCVVEVNRKALREWPVVAGVSRKDLVGRQISDVTRRLPALADLVFECLRTGSPAALRESGGDPEQRFAFEIRVEVLRDSNDHVVGAIVTSTDITESIEQAEKLEESDRLIEAFRRVGEVALSSLDFDRILDDFSMQIVSAGIFRSLMVALVDEDQQGIEVVRNFVSEHVESGRAVRGAAMVPATTVVGTRYTLDDDNITPTVTRTGEMQVIDGFDNRFDRRYDSPDEKAADKVSYFLPVKRGERVLAVLGTGSVFADKRLTLDRIAAMQPLLAQFGVALEHARVYRRVLDNQRDMQVNLSLQRVRNEILVMQSELDWEKILDVAENELRSLVGHDVCCINLVNPADQRVSYYGINADGRRQFNDGVIHGPVRAAIQTGEPQYRRNKREMKEQGDAANMVAGHAHSIVDVPFNTGTIAINSAREDAFDDEDIRILTQFSQVMSEAHRRLQDLNALAIKERELLQAQKMEAVGQLTAGIAHNFNNMLQGVAGNLELAHMDVEGEAGEAIDGALDATHRAAEMVQQLLTFSRLGAGAKYRPVDLVQVVRDTEAICMRTFDRKIAIVVDWRKLPPAVGDSMQLQQVFLNLCINARDSLDEFHGGAPTIGISMETADVDEVPAYAEASPGSYIRVCVADNGRGMDEETRSRIFEPFFTTKEVDRGTGLGLSTAFGIARDHGGWITCDGEPGGGARFEVFLPVAKDPVAAGETSPIDHGGMGSETILIIDDEEMVRSTARQMLEIRGYEVFVASDGNEGIEMVRELADRVDVVLLDQSMPKLSGRDVLPEIRRISRDIKVVIFTGFAVDLSEFEGAHELIRKPFSLAGLTSKVREVLDRV